MKQAVTNHLFARPSFISGAASLFDVGGVLIDYNFAESSTQADTQAIFNDWLTVGNDISKAYERIRKE